MSKKKEKKQGKQNNSDNKSTDTNDSIAEKLLTAFQFITGMLITMDEELISIKMRRAFSVLIDLAFCAVIFYTFKNYMQDDFGWMVFVTITGVYFFVEGILGAGMLGKQLTSLKIVVEDFAQEDEEGNKQQVDFEIARLCLRALLKGAYLAVVTLTLCTPNDNSWIVFVGVYWLMFRLKDTSRLPHDLFTGTHIDCKSEDYYNDISENKVYVHVDKVLDKMFKNTQMQTIDGDVSKQVLEDEDFEDSSMTEQPLTESPKKEHLTEDKEQGQEGVTKEDKVTADAFIRNNS